MSSKFPIKARVLWYYKHFTNSIKIISGINRRENKNKYRYIYKYKNRKNVKYWSILIFTLQLAIKRITATWERHMIWNCIDRRRIRCLTFASSPLTRQVTILVISCRWAFKFVSQLSFVLILHRFYIRHHYLWRKARDDFFTNSKYTTIYEL